MLHEACRSISFEKGMLMATIARIIGLSLLTAGLGAWLGYALFAKYGDPSFASFVLACVGGIIGAVAGAAGEIVAVLRQRPQCKQE
jgi:uncharacterized membrane protein YfcA